MFRQMFEAQNMLLISLCVCLWIWILWTKDDENLLAKHILRKIHVYMDSVFFMIFSKDTKGLGPTKNPDPDIIKGKDTQKKTVIFIRHGESDWNDVFNKGINPGMIVRLGNALYQEARHFPSQFSAFIDSPLNHDGIIQAVDLSKYIQSLDSASGQPEEVVEILNTLRGLHADKSSIIVSSSLRRALATTTLALWPRIIKTHEKIHILSSLQEISRNVDTYAMSASKTVADLPFERIHPYCSPDEPFKPEEVYDATENFGNKTLNFYGIKRLKAFNDWIFARKEDAIIVGGHSLWFRHFFNTYLPHSFDHPGKKMKIANSGIVAFELHSYLNNEDGEKYYRIEPKSIVNVYGGFTPK
jgi:broad specificity phosphatase PhoE